jgi:tetrahydromethanopterin S-methyltransferase subunit A
MTLPNGIVTSEIIVVATTLEVPTATTTIIATQNGGLRTGRIVGAAVGGVVALSLLAVLIWYL